MEKRRHSILEALPRVVAGLALVMLTATAATARAEVVAYSNDTWTISFDGRSNAYYSYEWGDAYPHWTLDQIASFNGNPPPVNSIIWNGFQNQSNQDPTMCMANGLANGQVCTFTTSRVHTGFVGNDFGFTIKKKISDALKVDRSAVVVVADRDGSISRVVVDVSGPARVILQAGRPLGRVAGRPCAGASRSRRNEHRLPVRERALRRKPV